AAGDTITCNGDETLYAQWSQNTSTITFDPNGGTGDPADQTCTSGSVTLSSTVPTRPGYTFTGWSYFDAGVANVANPGDSISCTDLTLTAVWSQNTSTIAYDPNGGTGDPADQTCTSGVQTTLSSTVPTRSGYTFLGWNTAADGSGTDYAAGSTASCADLTLYARWTGGPFDPITTSGDGWDVTFHPTNQNYVFFVHHKSSNMGCVYRLDPDGAGPIQQGDGCFDSGQLLSLGSNVAVGLKSSMWVTSDGNTAYIPLNHESYAPNTIVRVNISDADPNNWSVIGTVNWAANMQHHSNSIMVDDALWASASSGLLKYDTTTQQASTYSKSMWEYAPVVHADGKIWSVASDWSLVCLDIATGAFCSHGSFVDGAGAALGVGSAPSVVMEYRNTDGSFGGFCSKDGGSNEVCVNTDGASSSTMVNPASNFNSGWGSWSANGLIEVSDQHQMIQYQPLASTQNYTCWDYTTQAACAGFTPSSTSAPSSAYTVRQDPWIPTCFWTNAHDNKIGVWDFSASGGFATTGGECTITSVELNTITYTANGGSGAPAAQTCSSGLTATVSSTVPTRSGYTFLGWNTANDGSGTTYGAGTSITCTNETLYAQWSPDTQTIAYDPNGGT
ncbi:MAG: InlB B-repeat-containing protein, partial [Ilumatobacteraceae bacterium]